MPPRARRFTDARPQPQTSRRTQDVLYQSTISSSVQATSEKQQSAIIKYVTAVPKEVTFDGSLRNWPAFEDVLLTFLRGHGIAQTINADYNTSADFQPTHNEALYTFLLSAVSKHPTVYAVFRRAPSGDGNSAYCFLSAHYGVRDPSTLMAELQYFTPHDAENPFATALRLGTLYADLSLADKPHHDWEKVAKLLDFLEGCPQADFGAVSSRIEDASNSRGISFDEAVTWLGHRQSTLDSRMAVSAIVPRTRPVYQAAVHHTDESPQSSPPAKNSMEQQFQELQKSVGVFMAANHRHQPPPKAPMTPRENCPQTPGLKLRRIAAPCRVDGCSTPSRSRLCEEHALQLVSKKARSLPCTTNAETRFAHYGHTPAAGSKPEWRGILIRDAAAERDANGEKPA
jgi:hypothetical protein